MPKIPRITQKVFGDTASAVNNFGVFGSLAAGTPLNSKDLAQIQSLPAWLQGLAGAVVGNKSPAFEDINSLFYAAFKQIAYLLQQGVAEWDANTPYYIGNTVAVASVDYLSKTDNNLGNAVTDTNNWIPKFNAQLQALYPVNEIYVTHRTGNPATLLGFGTWTAYGAGRMPAFAGAAPFNTLDATGGEENHTLTVEELPANNTIPFYDEGGATNNHMANGGNIQNGTFTFPGSGQAHNNLPPYIPCWYAWLRTA